MNINEGNEIVVEDKHKIEMKKDDIIINIHKFNVSVVVKRRTRKRNF